MYIDSPYNRSQTPMTINRVLTLCLALCLASYSSAQQPPVQPGATLSGHVYCGDTNVPARFAKVMLKSTGPSAPGDDIFGALSAIGDEASGGGKNGGKPRMSAEEAAQQKEQLAAASKMFAAMSDMLYNATVGIDGTYTFTNVKPGTYYVHATVAGYVDPFSSIAPDDLTSQDPAVKKRVASLVTVVTIDGNSSARADLRLERGASVTGRVVYDDGSPAAGWTVRPVHPTPAGPNPFAALGVDASDLDFAHISENSITDDTGRFHISGLSSGDYILQARLVTATLGTSAANPLGGSGIGAAAGGIGGGASILGDRMGLRLTVYSGDALRLADAKPVKLGAGEDRTGVDITMPLHALHSIGGRVVSKADGRPVNSGTVELTAQDAAGKDDASIHLTATIRSNGTFRFDYVPGPFTFTLKVANAKELQAAPAEPPAADSKAGDDGEMPSVLLGMAAAGKTKTIHTYGPATATVALAGDDVDGVALSVPELAAASAP